ncbi:MAG: precorrin-2 C(20)-methyltransferase [Planctomycetota bacterium]
MKLGTLYGVGVGPGDPNLITVKGAAVLSQCRHVFTPKAKDAADSVALAIAERHVSPDAKVHEIVFPMTRDRAELRRRWAEAAEQVAAVLRTGEDACFLTLGDALLYSTYIYLVRALRAILPDVGIVTVPGITAFSAAAALAEFPVGEAKSPVTIIPTADDLEDMRRALAGSGTVILMKIGKHLPQVLDAIEEGGAIDRAVFVSHVGMENERIETDLGKLRDEGSEAGYLSIILVRPAEEGDG